jgi:hypothetical protein
MHSGHRAQEDRARKAEMLVTGGPWRGAQGHKNRDFEPGHVSPSLNLQLRHRTPWQPHVCLADCELGAALPWSHFWAASLNLTTCTVLIPAATEVLLPEKHLCRFDFRWLTLVKLCVEGLERTAEFRETREIILSGGMVWLFYIESCYNPAA